MHWVRIAEWPEQVLAAWPSQELTHLAIPGEGEGALAQAGNLLAQPIRPLRLRPQMRLHSTAALSAFCCLLSVGHAAVMLKHFWTIIQECSMLCALVLHRRESTHLARCGE